jgi:chromosome segregation ATPase
MRAQFVQLQNLDQQLAQRLGERDAVWSALGERDVLRALAQSNHELVGQLKQERATSSDLQWELEEIEVRLRALHVQEHDGPGDPLVARELALLHKQRTEREEQVLHQLDRIAALEHVLQQAESDYAERYAAWTQREGELQAQLEQIGQTIDTLYAKRERIAQQQFPSMLAQYQDLQRRHRGTALAPIRNHQCSMCYARLPAAVFDMLVDPAALVRCPRCGRVVYLES